MYVKYVKKKCLVVFFKNVQFLIFIILDSHIFIDLLVNRTQELLCPSFAKQETNRKRKSGITEGGLRMSESQKREKFITSAG